MSDNHLPHIDALWAFLSVDEGGEGLCGAPLQDGVLSLPMIGADEARVMSLRPIAFGLAKASGKRITLVRFHAREDIEVFEP